MAPEAGGDDVRGIGARLRDAREKNALTVLQAAEKLHVDARLLEALEAQNFAALGAEVYVRGHLRRYAELLGESPSRLLELHAGGTPAAAPDLTRIPRSEPASDSSRLMLPALLVVGGFGVAGLLWWLLGMQSEKAQPLSAAAPAEIAPASAVPGPGMSMPPGEAAATASRPPPPAGTGPSAGRAQLALKFSAPSWVEISDADGRRLLHGLIESGSARTLTGASPLRVILGNAPAVALQVNERPVALAGLVHRDGSAHLLIDAAGRAAAAPPRLADGD
jgi:cytoskeleton protein RodZ